MSLHPSTLALHELLAGATTSVQTTANAENHSQPRPGGSVDLERIQNAVREILAAVGENPEREGLLETPARVARMYAEVFAGLHLDPAVHLQKTFTQKHDEMVLVKEIAFSSCCEHHLLPFTGQAHIAYLPDGKVVGLSKLARVVEVIARRPQVQERMTEDLADLIMRELNPRGVGVILEASHSCMTIRGVRKPGAMTITSALRGLFRSNPTTRSELMSLVFGASRS
ncbi:MAG: GTP cyclohydrolase I FolE [Bacteroidales bacterium]|nr:GTP cyclohydrolase I FolE [Bacteroidales bacterium]